MKSSISSFIVCVAVLIIAPTIYSHNHLPLGYLCTPAVFNKYEGGCDSTCTWGSGYAPCSGVNDVFTSITPGHCNVPGYYGDTCSLKSNEPWIMLELTLHCEVGYEDLDGDGILDTVCSCKGSIFGYHNETYTTCD